MYYHYTFYQDYMYGLINEILSKYEVSLVIYDETEYFRDYNDVLFKYPYVPQKTILHNFNFNVDPINTYDYDIGIVDLKL